jgi:hypothetical protein
MVRPKNNTGDSNDLESPANFLETAADRYWQVAVNPRPLVGSLLFRTMFPVIIPLALIPATCVDHEFG